MRASSLLQRYCFLLLLALVLAPAWARAQGPTIDPSFARTTVYRPALARQVL
jgi:hypothetical protein